jgi:ribosomal protein S27AE
MSARNNTPDRVNDDGSHTITTKRACNGCGELLGDITNTEMAAAIAGSPLPDVRRECPQCGPTAPEPACVPMQLVAGDMLCLDLECDHDAADAGAYCSEVREETACATHSKSVMAEHGFDEVVHAEPWPCQAGGAS